MSAANQPPAGPPQGPTVQHLLELRTMHAQAHLYELCLFLDQLGVTEATLSVNHWRCTLKRADVKPVIERPNDAQVIDINDVRNRRKE